MKTNEIAAPTKKLYRIAPGSIIGRAHLALGLLLIVCGLFGIVMITTGAWSWAALSFALFALLCSIWPAIYDHSALVRHPDGMDEVRTMQVRSIHAISQHTAADWPDTILSDGSDIC